MKKIIENYTLSPLGIDQISEKISEWLKENNESSKNIVRMRLTIEEMLLSMKEHFGEECECSLYIKKRLGIPSIHLYYKGEPFNPVNQEQNQDELSEQFLKNIGLSPIWAYKKGVNEISLRSISTGHRSELLLLGSLVLALFFGLSVSFMPKEFIQAIEICFSTISSIFLRLLNTFAGLMAFMCIANGISGIGNLSEFSKIGRKMIVRYIIYSFVATACATCFFYIFYHLPLGQDNSGKSQVAEIFKLLFNILPENPVKPFLERNTLQIATIAIFMGLITLVDSERLTVAKSFFQDFSILIGDAIRVICKLLPLYIVSSLTLLFWENGYDVIAKLWKPVFLSAAIVLLFSVTATAYVSLRLKISPRLLFKKIFPAAFIGLTTASSVAAFSSVLETCEKKLGIDLKFTKIAVPIGHILFAAPLSSIFVISGFFLASYFHMEISILWLVQLVFMSLILVSSTPPIPGTYLACLTIFFTQLNIPLKGIPIAATLGTLIDFILTCGRIYLNTLEILIQANNNNLLDKKILKKE